ncbi:MAG: DUF4465 domain-containing protein [Phycisphaeraceae bacterium]|nr:DUF4465 domain-containing protein [Phycisphaeraceae bacterium]
MSLLFYVRGSVRLSVAAVIFTVMASSTRAEAITAFMDFEDLLLSPESAWSGTYPSDGVGGVGLIEPFYSRGVGFDNFSDGDWFYWSGFAYSNKTDVTTAGYTNSLSAFAGSGVLGSANYAVADTAGPATVHLPVETEVLGAYVTNTTYAALSMLNGDGFAKKFGGATGADEDWLLLTISGWDAEGQKTGEVEFYLADYRNPAGQDVLVTDWTWVNLEGLGNEVKRLTFWLTSSDVGLFGMNTPSFFALDNLYFALPVEIPEPGTGAMLVLGGLLFLKRRRGV